MRTVGVPGGIGDVSWVYSKLHCLPAMRWEVADGWPYRTVPFLSLLPKVAEAAYGEFSYTDIISSCNAKGAMWPSTWAIVNGHDRVLLEANMHLEAGKRLEDWLPDLECDFHYQINTTDEHKAKAEKALEGFARPIWGISAASYRGSEAWKTWGFAEWSEFLKKFHERVGGTIILLGGFWDDLTSSLSNDGYADLVGRTDIGTAVEVLKRLDGYFGFSSGLGVLMTVLNRKTMMLWPDHQLALRTSWAPPEMLQSGRYVALPWLAPDLILNRAKEWAGEP